ncbi:MAG: hypothetical protein MHPSP_003167 [Paramarteilia canceri]
MENPNHFGDDYEVLSVINTGSFATVHQCKNKSNKEICAGKFIKKDKMRNDDLVDGGELFDEIVSRSSYSERDAHSHIIQLYKAIDYCHSLDIIHRDIKPENILIKRIISQNSVLKLADFGVSKDISVTGEKHFPIAGSFGYMAPEVAKRKKNGKKCDVFSAGIILYIMLCGYPPFPQTNDKKIALQATCKPKIRFNTKNWDSISNDAIDLIEKMTLVNTHHRISIDEALQHKWCKSIENVEGIKLERNSSLKDFREFNSRRKFLAVLGAMSFAGLLSNTIRSASEDHSESSSEAPIEDLKKKTIFELETLRFQNIDKFCEKISKIDPILVINQETASDIESFKNLLNKLQGSTISRNTDTIRIRIQELEESCFGAMASAYENNKEDSAYYLIKDNQIKTFIVYSGNS